MPTIAALGPEDAFSETAAKNYAEKLKGAQIQLFPTIRKTFMAAGNSCDLCMLPIENMLDGFVPLVLDLLLHTRLTIIDEYLLPISFSFAANCADLKEVKRVHVQFAAQGQCVDFLESLPNAEIKVSQSNGAPLRSLREGVPGDAAIVPTHSLDRSAFPLVIYSVADYETNITRFVVLAEQERAKDESRRHKTSIAILEGVDRPGMLSEILAAFSSRKINLMSIMSRPTKEVMGKYHFFIDFEGHVLDAGAQAALAEVRKYGYVKLLGSYPIADAVAPTSTSIIPMTEIPALRRNPFKTGAAPVFVSSGGGPYANTIEALSHVDLSPAEGKRVLLKPNAGRLAEPGSGVTTHPQVVAAAIDAFKAAGAEVFVGESPITGIKTPEAFEITGIAAVARERGCPCIDMDERPAVEVALTDRVAIDKLKVCADVFDFDIIVSIPVMKMHMHTVVTLSVKNMKGCLWRRSKVELHMLPNVPYYKDKTLNIAIADMASVLVPHMAIIDGTTGMEGLGPSAGDPKQLGVVVVSADAFAADSVACRLMGVEARDVPHLRICEERGYGNLDIGTMDVRPDGWEQLRSAFAPVPTSMTIQYPNVKVLDENSCSACQSTLMLFLKKHGNELGDYFPDAKPVTVVIGKGHTNVPLNSLCIGNCTRQFKEQGIYISGCPPVVSSIKRTLDKRREDGGK